MATYAEIYDGPPAHYGDTATTKRYIAIHNTANDATAAQEISYAQRRTDSVSSHYYVDGVDLLQSLDTSLRAFHAGSSIGNSQAIAYEITGTNGMGRAWWLANVAWPKLARQIAADCRRHRITPQLLTVEQIEAGRLTGIITHDQMRLAWGGTTHTDPGPNFPLDHLVGLVVAELEDDMTPQELLNTKLSNGYSINNALVTLLARVPTDVVGRLDAILAAARDDADVTVVLDPQALDELAAVRADIAALPTAADIGAASVDALRAELND